MPFNKQSRLRGWLFFLTLLMVPSSGWGHASGENYIFIDVFEKAIKGRFELHLSDINEHLKLKLPDQLEAVEAYVAEHSEIGAGGDVYAVEISTNKVISLPQGEFLQLEFEIDLPEGVPDVLTVRNTMFFEYESKHRGLVCLNRNAKDGEAYGAEYTALVLSPSNPEKELDLLNVSGLEGFIGFIKQGAWHIAIGWDHILFLLALTFPLVLRREGGRWQAVDAAGQALANAIRVMICFTVAYSLGLILGATGVVSLPARPVESIIALSIFVVAIHNIFPVLHGKAWLLTLAFGLFHGLGFAFMLGNLQFRMVDLLKTVIAFIIGVGFGECVIVAGAVLVFLLLRKQTWYARVVLVGGSALTGLVGMYWFVERAFDL